MSKSWHPGEPDDDWAAWPDPVRARGQRHRDAPLSARERVVWMIVWIFLGLLAVAMLAYMVIH